MYGLATARRLLGDCSATARRLLGDGLSDARSLRKRQLSIEKGCKTQQNRVSDNFGALLCTSPFKLCFSPRRWAQSASKCSISGAKTIKANARKPIEFDQRCAQLLENEALAREWTSIYGSIQAPNNKNAQMCNRKILLIHTFDQEECCTIIKFLHWASVLLR